MPQTCRRFRVLLASLLILGASSGCDITDFLVPSSVAPGDTAQLEVELASAGEGGFAYTLFVMLRVPSSWTVTSSGYSGVVNGSGTSGTPTQSTTDPSTYCDFSTFVGTAPAGQKDVWFSQGFVGALTTDTGSLTADFLVGAPTGFFVLRAATAVEDASSGACIETATRGVTVTDAPSPVPWGGRWALAALALILIAAVLARVPMRSA